MTRRQTKEEKAEAIAHERYVGWLMQQERLDGDELLEVISSELPTDEYEITGPIGFLTWSPGGVATGGLSKIWILAHDDADGRTRPIAASPTVMRLVYAAQQFEGDKRTREAT